MIAAITIPLCLIMMYQWIKIQDLKGNLKELEVNLRYWEGLHELEYTRWKALYDKCQEEGK